MSAPDFIWELSGGIDSTAAFILTREALHENFQKRPIAVYLDTRIGIPANRMYVEELCDHFDTQLWKLRTHEKFEDRVAEEGCPGPAMHGHVRNELKGRQLSKLETMADNPVFITGIRADESDVRAKMGKGQQLDRSKQLNPVFELTKEQCARIILNSGAPINPLWTKRYATDCGCMANGDPSEPENIEEDFPWFGRRLREIEESARFMGKESYLGWGGLTTQEQRQLDHIGDDVQSHLCGGGCNREIDLAEPILDEFKDRAKDQAEAGGVAELFADGGFTKVAEPCAEDGGRQ